MLQPAVLQPTKRHPSPTSAACLHAPLPCSLLPVVSQVAATLHFNPHLEYLADRVVSYITRDGRRAFNGAPALLLSAAAPGLGVHTVSPARQGLLQAGAVWHQPSRGSAGQLFMAASGLPPPPCAAGAHLRVEKDAAEWFIILGGAQVREGGRGRFVFRKWSAVCQRSRPWRCRNAMEALQE